MTTLADDTLLQLRGITAWRMQRAITPAERREMEIIARAVISATDSARASINEPPLPPQTSLF